MLIPMVLLLTASCTVPVDGAGAKGRKLPGANSFLRTGQTLPTGRQGAGMVMLKSNIVVFGGVAGGGACGKAQRESRRGRERRRLPRCRVPRAGHSGTRGEQRARETLRFLDAVAEA